MRPLRYLLLPAALGVALALPPAASAVIVPQKGMLGVSLGMTAGQIQARLGPPDRVRRPVGEIIGRYTEYTYGEVHISLFSGAGGRAFNFFTRGRSARTLQGVGVGSSEAYLRSALRGETCATEAGVRHCYLGRFLPGRIVTDFRISTASNRVTSVTVGRVID
jgi:hypothetical protein